MADLTRRPSTASLAEARNCYDHVAGRLGVRLYESMLATGVLARSGDVLVLGPNRAPLDLFGIDPSEHRGRPLLRECLDRTEHRPHLAGALAAKLLAGMLSTGWLTRTAQPRALVLTSSGIAGLAELELLDGSGVKAG